MTREITMRSADIEAMGAMEYEDEGVAAWEVASYRERLSEAALIDAARRGMPEDMLRHLCYECGIEYNRIEE